MSKLAIKGHSKQGKKVIEILEMLGGKSDKCWYTSDDNIYFINTKGFISATSINNSIEYIVYTLEEFEEKFPYKVGDKVYYQPIPQINSVCISEIISMKWIDGSVVYYTSNGHEVYVCDLQPYKEETMEEDTWIVTTADKIDFTFARADKIKLKTTDTYEVVVENGETYVVRKKSQYQKTYEECFNICFGNKHHIVQVVGLDGLGDNKELFENFIKLKICRDAYWKIAGEQMGLGKPWEPDWINTNSNKYCIYYVGDEIKKQPMLEVHHFLAFPTAEMRDAFYENFKDLIEQCKELL